MAFNCFSWQLHRAVVMAIVQVWRELALSLISLNEKTATTYDFPQSAFADSEVAVMSCGRAASNAMVLQERLFATP